MSMVSAHATMAQDDMEGIDTEMDELLLDGTDLDDFIA